MPLYCCCIVVIFYCFFLFLFSFSVHIWLFLLSVEQLNVSALPRLSKTNSNTARTVKCTVLYCIVLNHIVMTTIITPIIIIAIIYSYPWFMSPLSLLVVPGNIHLGHTFLVCIFRELCWWASGQTEVLCSVWFHWEERALPSGACDCRLLCGQNRISRQEHDIYSAAANRWKWRWGTEVTVQIRWQALQPNAVIDFTTVQWHVGLIYRLEVEQCGDELKKSCGQVDHLILDAAQ